MVDRDEGVGTGSGGDGGELVGRPVVVKWREVVREWEALC